jgi:hypothetical protein
MQDGERPRQPTEPGGRAARLTNRRSLLAAGAGGVAAAAAIAPAAAGDAPLAGAWLATSVRQDPTSDFPTIRFLYTFYADGSLSADGPPTVLEGTDRVYNSARHGAWRALGGRRYAFHYIGGVYDDRGAYRFTIVLSADVALADTGDAWSGSYRRTDLALDGSILRQVPGMIEAVLIRIES